MILSLVYAAAASQALLCVHMTGNYVQIRRYLWACLADALATGLYVFIFGNEYGADNVGYLALYSATTAGILAAAWTVGWRAMSFCNPEERRMTMLLSLLAGLIGFWAIWRRGALEPFNVIQLVSASMLTSVVIQVSRSLDDVDEHHRWPIRTLATLWATQLIFFYCFAAGYPLWPVGWSVIGEWLPGSIMAAFLMILSFTFKGTPRPSEQAEHRRQQPEAA